MTKPNAEETTVKFQVFLTEVERQKLKEKAVANRTSMQAVVRSLIQDYNNKK